MKVKLGKYSIELSVLAVGLSYFVVLINPLGWHMFLHVAPLYIFFLLSVLQQRITWKYKSQLFIMALFVLYTLISAVFISNNSGTYGKIIRFIYEFIIFVFFVSYKFSEKNLKYLFYAYNCSCFAVCIKMILQRAHIVSDTQRFSIVNHGKIMDPNYLASLFVLPIIIFFYRCVKNGFQIRRLIPLMTLLVAVLATGSRGAFVSLILGCGIIYFKENISAKKLLTTAIILIGLFCVLLLFLPSSVFSRFDYHNFHDDSNSLRFNLWETAIRIFASNPFFGRGANSMINLGKSYGARINLMAHNSYLEILADYGLLGFLLWIFPFVSIMLKSIKQKKYLIVGILTATYSCAFFISAQDSAFLWQNVLLCYVMLRFDQNIVLEKKKRREHDEKLKIKSEENFSYSTVLF